MKKLAIGDEAPDFTMKDLNNVDIKLSYYQGKKVLLSFFRFATCPFCTVRFAHLVQDAQHYADQGIYIIAVFESSPEYIKQYMHNSSLAFPVIADPEGKLYSQYGVKKSLLGMMLGMMRLPTLMKAMLTPGYKMAKPDSSMKRIPADFVINEGQTIVDSYYGKDIGDHIPFKRIDIVFS
ncbi:MAG: redoxin domain-containing protein [Gammaproteobacteria bacterium]|nr:redoxin domain-containing protein [Gammaproteobacteria bacterium]